MAEDRQGHIKIEGDAPAQVESTDRGLFDFLGGKKGEEKKPHHDAGSAIATEFDQKANVSDQSVPVEQHKEEAEEKKHGSLLEKLHRSGSSSSSSSSSEEEVEEDGKKIRRKKDKKGVKEKIKEKVSGEKKEEAVDHETHVPVEKYDDPQGEEKKGFLHKIKEKLPGSAGGQKKPEEVAPAAPVPVAPPTSHTAAECNSPDGVEAKEKKGFLEKIKEKLPGYHPKTEEEKEKEKEAHASH